MHEPISALADGDETKKRILKVLESIRMSPSPDISLSPPIEQGGSVDPFTHNASPGADVLNAIGEQQMSLRPSITLDGHLTFSGHIHPTTRLVPAPARHPIRLCGFKTGRSYPTEAEWDYDLPNGGYPERKVKVGFVDALVIEVEEFESWYIGSYGHVQKTRDWSGEVDDDRDIWRQDVIRRVNQLLRSGHCEREASDI